VDERLKKKKKPREDFGDDPHAADFPDCTIDDIRPVFEKAELMVGQKKTTRYRQK